MNDLASHAAFTPAAVETAISPPDAKTLFERAVALEGLDKTGKLKRGAKPNHTAANTLYQQAAQMGCGPAMYNLAMNHMHGRGFWFKRRKQAVQLLRQAADKGIARAYTNLGYCYEYGLGGLDQDEKEAERYYKLGAILKDETGAQNAEILREQQISRKKRLEPILG